MSSRNPLAFACAVAASLLTGGSRGVAAQTAGPPSLVGSWTLNKDLSGQPGERSTDDRRGDRQDGRRGGGGFRGGGFGGGRRGGGGRGGDGGRGGFDPEQAARARDAMRDIANAPEHLTIVQTDSMIIVTAQDGRTTRLSADGRKIKDESTKLERKTKWEAGKLVSEITGLAGAKIAESYWVDAERRQLHVTVHRDDDQRPLTLSRVYDADSK